MLTYQLQQRLIAKTNDKEFVFPNDITIEVYLEPTGQFGIGKTSGKTILAGSKSSQFWDANTGKTWSESEVSLKPIDTSVEFTNLKLELKGNIILAKARRNSLVELYNLLVSLHYTIPILLNLEFVEPPVVKYTRGTIGEATFNWIVAARAY